MERLLLRWAISAIALWIVAQLGWGVSFESGGNLVEIFVSALVLGLVNAIVRPIMIILTLPLTLVTLGLFLFVVNALALWLVAAVTPLQVHGFWGALLGSLVLSLVTWALNRLIRGDRKAVA